MSETSHTKDKQITIITIISSIIHSKQVQKYSLNYSSTITNKTNHYSDKLSKQKIRYDNDIFIVQTVSLIYRTVPQ